MERLRAALRVWYLKLTNWWSVREALVHARIAASFVESERDRAVRDLATQWELVKDLQEEVRIRDHDAAMLRGENEVLRAQLEMNARWMQREMSRLESETAMLAARKVAYSANLQPRTIEELTDGRL